MTQIPAAGASTPSRVATGTTTTATTATTAATTTAAVPIPTASITTPMPTPSTTNTTTTTRPRRASTASYVAMSDDEEGDYNTVTNTETGHGVKLLFSKSKVYIHPTPSVQDNIAGYMALLEQRGPHDGGETTTTAGGAGHTPQSSDLLLAWVPESSLGDAASIYVKVDLCDGDEPPRQTYLVPPPPTITTHREAVGHYAFAIPVSAVYSLLVRPPSLGWWYGSVIINSRAGDSFPALFFHDNECQSTMRQKRRRTRETFDPFGENGEVFWGGDEVLRWLRRYVHIERSGAEPNIYLVEPSREDSEAFSGTLKGGGSGGGGSSGGGVGIGSGVSGGSSSIDVHARDAGMDPIVKFVKETGWNLLEKFSKVTTFTRHAAQNVLDDPRVPPPMRRLLRNPDVQSVQDEFDSARIYLARWAMGMAEQAERERHERIWTADEVMELEDTDVGAFELVDGTSGLAVEARRKPVTQREWASFFDARTGRLAVTTDEVKERVFHGGLDADDGVRKEAWLFLLGVHEWYSTADERRAQVASLRDQYIRLKGVWWERMIETEGQGEEGEWWREQRGRIEKDVHRTDRHVAIFAGENIPHPDPDSPFAEAGTNVHLEQLKDLLLTYNEYNRELGYVQGMSDLLAPIYAVVQDDAMAFWAFQHFMDRMERNFLRDQSGMRAQLLALNHLVQFMDPKLYAHLAAADSTNFFFFFRMLLVWYKREFEWPDVLRLWETLWTDYLSSSFHLFVALAILERHRDVIMTHLQHFDEVLKYVNELSGTIELESTLVRAEVLYRRFQRLVEAVDKKGHFPAPKKEAKPEGAPATQTADKSKTKPAAASAAAASSSHDSQGTEMTSMGRRSGKAPATASTIPAPDDTDETPTRVITPDLRALLSRAIFVVPKPKQQTGEAVLWGHTRGQ